MDIKDKKILAELDLNARATFKEIGKRTKLSKETAIYRINNLEKKKIIQRYTTLVNFAKLGYTGYAIFSRFENVDEKTKTGIINYLKNIPELYWIALVGGKYDLAFAIMAKNVFQFNKIYYKILNKYSLHLIDNTIAIRLELRQHKRNYLTNQKPETFKAPFFGKEPKIIELDELDSNILSILSNQARISVIAIAKILKRSPSTITARIKSLTKKKIIEGFTTYIKAQNFGMQSYRLLINLQNKDEKTRNSLFSYVNSNPHMILAIETLGEWNFEITLEVESHEQLQQEISNLRKNFQTIKNIEFLIMFEDDLVYDPYPLKKLEKS